MAQRICDHIASGGYATDTQRFGLPEITTINRWLVENEAFSLAYARAREARAETFANQIIEIADTEEDPARARVRVEARKWVASKLLPRVYGENQRVEVQHTLSETAARVLADLSARQKREKAERAKYIDVTPVPARAKDPTLQQDQPLAIEATASRTVEGQSAAPAVDPPPPGRNRTRRRSGAPPHSAQPSGKNKK